MNSETGQTPAILRRLEARERASRFWAAAFTLVPLALVATLVTLSVRWVGEAQREVAAARVEAADYRQKLAAGDRPAADLAGEVLRYQAEAAAREEQVRAANERADRLEQALASAQTPGDAKNALDYEALIRRKDEQIAAAREEGRAAGARAAEQVLAQVRASEQQSRERQRELEAQADSLSRARDEEAAARQRAERELKNAEERAEREVREARDRAAQAEREAARADRCCDAARASTGERDEARAQLERCRASLRDCERSRPSDNQLEEATREAATWKERAARCEAEADRLRANCQAEINKLKQENERLRVRLRQFERETPP